MKSEAFADDFATKYIMKHYDDFFESSSSSDGSSEKVKTHIGELMSINSNIKMLGLTEGKAVRMTKLEIGKDENGKQVLLAGDPPSIKEGFLERKIKINEGISLLKEGDYASKERFPESPAVTNVYIRPWKDERGNVRNDILVQLKKKGLFKNSQKNTVYYFLEMTNEEPKEVEVQSKEIIDRYKLKIGSKIMLMKRNLGKHSAVSLGTIMGGRIVDHYQNGTPLKEKCGIYLFPTVGEKTGVGKLVDPEYMCGGNTSRVRRFYRKWKNYYIETNTSTYEIIPYK